MSDLGESLMRLAFEVETTVQARLKAWEEAGSELEHAADEAPLG